MDNQNKDNPFVSVAIMAYNRAHYLPALIESWLTQTYGNFELIISDDASSDGTQQICEEYAKKDARIRYIKQEKNLNQPTCFKFVLGEARGEYFIWANDDDLWDKRFLEECITVYRKRPDLIMVFAGMIDIDKDGKKIKDLDPAKYMPLKEGLYERLKEFLLFRFGDGKGQLIGGLWKREVIIDDPLFGFQVKDDYPPEYWGFDNFFNFRNLAKGKFGFVPEILFFRRSRVLDEAPRPPRWIIPRLAVSFYHRLEHAFKMPHFRYVARLIPRIKGLSYWEKIKLEWWNFYMILRLLFVRKI